MARDRPPTHEPVSHEEPTSCAELEIQVGPALPLGSAKGRVPPDQAGYFIMTIGIWGSVAVGIAGAILTLRIASRLAGIALAVLGLALIATLLIAACGLAQERARRAKGRRRGKTRTNGREGGGAAR